MIAGGVILRADRYGVSRPLDRQIRENLADPDVATGIPEQDEVLALQFVVRHFTIVLDGYITSVVAAPFVGEAIEIGVGPGGDGRIPRFPRAAKTKKRARESIVDWPLKAGVFVAAPVTCFLRVGSRRSCSKLVVSV